MQCGYFGLDLQRFWLRASASRFAEGILDNWGREFGFTGSELGVIGGAGFTGFCFGIIVGGIVVDKIGYGKLVIAAFLVSRPIRICNFLGSWRNGTRHRLHAAVLGNLHFRGSQRNT